MILRIKWLLLGFICCGVLFGVASAQVQKHIGTYVYIPADITSYPGYVNCSKSTAEGVIR